MEPHLSTSLLSGCSDYPDFVPSVTKYLKGRGLTVKALLLLDNASSHPDLPTLVSKDGNIKALFLPPNTTSLFQPMDQGVIEAMKRRYRKALLQKLLLEDQEGRSIIQFVKQINIKDVVYMTATAWEDIPSLTLMKSWNKLLRTAEVSVDSGDGIDEVLQLAQQLDSNLETEDVNTWINVDSGAKGYELLSDEDIVKQVTQTNDKEDTEEDDGDETEEIKDIPCSGDVKDMLNRYLLWYERLDECTATSLLLLKRVRDLAAAICFANLKQLTLHAFLNQ